MKEEKMEEWHLDKKVPIALMAAILLQTFAAGLYVSALYAQLGDQGRRLEKSEHKAESMDAENRIMSNRLVRVEDRAESILDAVKKIEQHLIEQDKKRMP